MSKESGKKEIESSRGELQLLKEKLSAARTDLENLLSSSLILAVFLDKCLRVRQFTPAATGVFPRIESEVGRPFQHISSRIEHPPMAMDAETVLNSLEVIDREVKTSDGKWYLLRTHPFRTDKDVIDGVVITMTDITERKKATMEQAMLAAIVTSSHDAIIAKTLDGTITTWNPGAEKMYGYSAEEVIGRPVSLLAPPGKKKEIDEILDRLRRGERIVDFETERVTKNGKRIFVSLTISPIKDAEGDLVGASTIARDITPTIQAMKTLEKAKEIAEDANRAKSEFLANVSHEIRTPMTVTLSALGQVLAGDLSMEQRKYLEIAQSSSRSLLKLLDEILDLSRIEARALKLSRMPFDLHHLVRETVESFSLMAREKGLNLSLEVDPEVPQVVVGDPDRLRQVLTNLLSNGIKFTEWGQVSLAVSPSTDPPTDPYGHLVQFSVRDSGIGIAKRDFGRLFRNFSQLDSSRIRRFGGVGLGLVISKGLVERMEGELRVESKKGKGSCFSFAIPLSPPREDPALRGALSTEETETGAGRRPAKILLVEDDPRISEMVSVVLRQQGWETETVENGFKALEFWETGRFHLILMDLQMPMLDGLQVTRAIRVKEKKNGKHIPILALTAHVGQENRDACLEAGMDGFLAKPADSADLLALIGQHLNGGD